MKQFLRNLREDRHDFFFLTDAMNDQIVDVLGFKDGGVSDP